MVYRRLLFTSEVHQIISLVFLNVDDAMFVEQLVDLDVMVSGALESASVKTVKNVIELLANVAARMAAFALQVAVSLYNV